MRPIFAGGLLALIEYSSVFESALYRQGAGIRCAEKPPETSIRVGYHTSRQNRRTTAHPHDLSWLSPVTHSRRSDIKNCEVDAGFSEPFPRFSAVSYWYCHVSFRLGEMHKKIAIVGITIRHWSAHGSPLASCWPTRFRPSVCRGSVGVVKAKNTEGSVSD